MEAMAMEAVPISTTVSGIPELIEDEETGLLCEQRDVEALEDAVRRVLENPSEGASMARRARKQILTRNSIMKQAEEMNKIFCAHAENRGLWLRK